MKFTLPIKFGDMYLHFDKNNNLDYGFITEFSKIKKFVKLSDKMPKTIVLPVLEYHENDEFNYNVNTSHIFEKQDIENYLRGKCVIEEGCFGNLDEIKIIVPNNTSIKFENQSFGKFSDITFILQENLEMKKVEYHYATTTTDRYYLIADKKANVNLKRFGYTITSFQQSDDFLTSIDLNRPSYDVSKLSVKDSKIIGLNNDITNLTID